MRPLHKGPVLFESIPDTLMKPMRMQRGNNYILLLGHLGAILTVTAWGLSFLATKVLMNDGGFTPVEVYVYRFALAYILLLFVTFRRLLSNNLTDELLFMACGICAGSLYFITENYALKYTSTGNVSLLASISPIFTTILMAIVFKTRIKSPVILGSLIAFIGVGCVIFSHGEGIEFSPVGDILALSAAMSWAVYTILVKRLIPNYTSLFITRKLFFYGVISAIPLLLLQHEPLHLAMLFDFRHPQYILNLLFLVLFCSMMAYIIWNEAMKILGPVTSNNYLYLQPLVTLVAAYFLFDEKIYFLGYLGCFLIIGGLVISDKLENLKLPRK